MPRAGDAARARAEPSGRRTCPVTAIALAAAGDVAQRDVDRDRRARTSRTAAAGARARSPVDRVDRAAGRPRAGCRRSSTSRRSARRRRCRPEGGKSVGQAARVDAHDEPVRAAPLERRSGGARTGCRRRVRADRLAVEPDPRAVVDRLEAHHPGQRAVGARAARSPCGTSRSPPAIDAFESSPRFQTFGTVTGVQPAVAGLAHEALLDALVGRVEPEQPLAVHQVAARRARRGRASCSRACRPPRRPRGGPARASASDEAEQARDAHHGHSQHGARRQAAVAHGTGRLAADRIRQREQLDAAAGQRPLAAHAHALDDRQAVAGPPDHAAGPDAAGERGLRRTGRSAGSGPRPGRSSRAARARAVARAGGLGAHAGMRASTASASPRAWARSASSTSRALGAGAGQRAGEQERDAEEDEDAEARRRR